MDAYLDAMRHYAVFSGRTSRSGFWQFYAVYLGIGFTAALLDYAFGTSTKNGGLLVGLVHLGHLVPQLAASVRRLHDTDRSGWWYLIAITGVGIIPLVVFFCLRGSAGPNRFGDVPVAEVSALSIASAQPSGAPAAPMPAAPSHVPAAHRDPIAEIERLGQLRSAGHLSQAEFEAMKARILTQAQTA